MSYYSFRQNNTPKKNILKKIGWSLIPITLGVVLAGFITNGTDTTLAWFKEKSIDFSDTIQELRRNAPNSLLNTSIDSSRLFEGISLKDILRGEDKYTVQEGAELPNVEAAAYVVGDAITGEIIIEKNSAEVLPIASVTKLMTASVALENLPETQTTKVSSLALATEGSRGMLRTGEEVEVSDLLYPLILVSSNDASEVLAEIMGRKQFIQAMNKQAANLGMPSTAFDDPSGLSENNVSTARDLFTLAEYLYNNHETVFEISKLAEYSQGGRTWVNANRFAGTDNYEGGKTGYTSKAQRTGVALFKVPFGEYGDRVITITLLKTNNRAEDYSKILKFLEENVDYNLNLDQPDLDFEYAEVSKLTFIGDLMFDRGVKSSVQNNFNNDYSQLFSQLPELKDADIAFANLEGPISDQGKNVGSKYSFRFEPQIANTLKESGIDIVSFANNRVGDWSLEAFNDTLSHLTNAGVFFAGAGENKQKASDVRIIQSNGIKVGYLAFSDVGPDWLEAEIDGPGLLIASDPQRLTYIKQAREKVDVLVVSYHWGEEYKEHNQRQEDLAKSSIDAGANLVIGHHPHVIQDIEEYNGGLIAYSLGNAIFDQHFSEETMEGSLLSVLVGKNGIIEYEEKIFEISSQYQPQKPISTQKLKTQASLSTAQDPDSLTISWVGDIIPGNPKKDSLQDHGKLFANVQKWISKSDIAIGNLEGNITTQSQSKCLLSFSSNCFAFKADHSFADALRYAGFDIVNIANNHSFDFGNKGFAETLETLLSRDIQPVGTANEITYERIKNIDVGFVSFTHSEKLNNINDLETIQSLTKQASRSADVVVVLFHGGAEGSKYQNTPQATEYYLGENRGNLRDAAYAAVDAGADLVFGSGPHVVRGMEFYKDKLIAYSTGNFAGYNTLFLDSLTSKSLGIEVTITRNGEIKNAHATVFDLSDQGIPKLSENNDTYLHAINRLSREDFGPEAALVTNEGSIVYKPNEGLAYGEVLDSSPCPAPTKNSTDTLYFNANRKNSVDSKYIPNLLAPVPDDIIDTRGRTICLQEEALGAFVSLHKQALADNVSIIPTSGFRSYETQDYLFRSEKEKNSGNEQYFSVAEPGHSEHQLGSTLDITSSEINFASASSDFDSTASYQWMQDNAANFGFVQSYTPGTEEITGYIPESWHWRYLGKEHALAIKSLEITPLEYLSDKTLIGG